MNLRVALYTFGQFSMPADDPVNDGFHLRNDPILENIENAPGFLARSGYASDPGPEPWGEEIYPRFYKERGDGWSPASLSLWSDLASPMAFSYFGLHAEALSHGREWFQKPQWPPYVLWWVDGSHMPQWRDASGQPTKIDRERLKAIVGLQAKQG